MYIKKIIIQGFKTYKNTTEIDLLSPHFNVVVGRNGSGKSNFFAAIRFVLSDTYTHMTREERQGLIHEGSGTVMSAYVEIIFDNSDRRFPIQKDEIAIRRTIGLKKDDYLMDGRSATRSDIMNLLESAGFSRLNPYYIVPQGKITALTNSKDSERLSLLKEVSGAKVFEAKLKESTKEMAHSNLKMDRIDESMEKLEEKLSDLQLESNDLKEYQQLEKKRKIYEFNLFDRELSSLSTQIQEYDEEYESVISSSHKDILELEKREKLCQDLQTEIDSLLSKLKVSSLEKEQAASDYNRALQNVAEKEASAAELSSTLGNIQADAEDQQERKAKLISMISANDATLLSELRPKLARLAEEENALNEEMADLSLKQRLLYAKQSRFLKFVTKAERNEWLDGEVNKLTDDLKAKSHQYDEVLEQRNENQEKLIECEGSINDLRAVLDDENQQKKIQDIEKRIEDIRAKITGLSDERKKLWRTEIKVRSLYDSAEHDFMAAIHKVAQTMDRAQAKGLDAVQEISERLNLQENVFGTLAESFTISDKYKTAVEVIAGNSLFHVLVDTDETALAIMSELVRLKAGRVTFIPLNRINVTPTTFPELEGHEYIPLIKKIKYSNKKVGKAIEQVFGKAVVCGNLQKGYELARSYNLNAITLDGDRVSTKGVISGGFRDYKTSRLESLKMKTRKKKEIMKLKEELATCAERLRVVNEDLTSATNQLDTELANVDKQKASLEPQRAELHHLLAKKFNLEKEITANQNTVDTLSSTISNLKAKLSQYKDEMNSKFSQALSESETEELANSSAKLSELEDKLNQTVSESASLETQISLLEAENSNFNAQLKAILVSGDHNEVGARQQEVLVLSKDIEALKKNLKELKKGLDSSISRHAELLLQVETKKTELEKENKHQVQTVKRLEGVGKKTERILSKKAILNNRREEVQEKINEIGVLPEEAFQQETFAGLSLDELLVFLNDTNRELKRYAHINRKAMEQYATFTKEKEQLEARKEELERSKVSIEQLMKSLEQQKGNAIKKSFEQVSESFQEIFEKLVPNGIGRLVMRTKENTDGVLGDQSIEDYVGVSIQVSFNSKEDEQLQIEQLSGGQKSLCAIALILAIQKCDPAPFYLFDEVDANLDTQYRTAVANMIQALAKSAQFICTTFRPEMLQVANMFFGVSFSNKVSTIREIQQEDALSFVEAQR